jgi:hypothetical protein
LENRAGQIDESVLGDRQIFVGKAIVVGQEEAAECGGAGEGGANNLRCCGWSTARGLGKGADQLVKCLDIGENLRI